MLLDDGRNQWPEAVWEAHVATAAEMVGSGGYVVQLVRSDDLDMRRWQRFMDLCARYRVRPMLRLATTFDREAGYWRRPPAGPQNDYVAIANDYAAFIGGLEWPDSEHFVIIGNEPNHGEEWGGIVDPAEFAIFLRTTALAIHAADPEAIVLNAPLDPFAPHTRGQTLDNGFTYMDAESFLLGMVAAEPDILHHLDAWATHSYPLGPFQAPPDVMTYQVDDYGGAREREVPPDLFNRGIRGYEWERYLLADYGSTGLPVYITETGWRHAESESPQSTDAEPGDLPSAGQVADYLESAFIDHWLFDNRVYGVMPFAFAGVESEWGHTNWVRLAPDGEPLEPYEMVARWTQLPGGAWP